MEHNDMLDLLRRARVVRVAGSLTDGTPVLRTVHAVVIDGWLAWHGGPKGEKNGLIGRPVVAGADEPLATIPSYFFDPERACPATTWFRSVQARGVLEAAADPSFKAAALQALMEKLQPEGGYVEITPDAPLYARMVEALVITRVRLDRMVGRDKRGQNKPPRKIRAALAGRWRRGGPGDVVAIEALRAAHPDLRPPDFLLGPAGLTFHVHGDEADAGACARLLVDAYWNGGLGVERMRRAFAESQAWVLAREPSGEIVATARATSDGGKGAWIYDVMVAGSHRGAGVGGALMRLLLDHPAVRGVKRVHLSTKDAMTFYERLGFRPSAEVCVVPWRRHFMTLDREQNLERGAGR